MQNASLLTMLRSRLHTDQQGVSASSELASQAALGLAVCLDKQAAMAEGLARFKPSTLLALACLWPSAPATAVSDPGTGNRAQHQLWTEIQYQVTPCSGCLRPLLRCCVPC